MIPNKFDVGMNLAPLDLNVSLNIGRETMVFALSLSLLVLAYGVKKFTK